MYNDKMKLSEKVVDVDVEMDSSDEEENLNAHFPWLKKNYNNVYDDLAYDERKNKGEKVIYPSANITDKTVELKREQPVLFGAGEDQDNE